MAISEGRYELFKSLVETKLHIFCTVDVHVTTMLVVDTIKYGR